MSMGFPSELSETDRLLITLGEAEAESGSGNQPSFEKISSSGRNKITMIKR